MTTIVPDDYSTIQAAMNAARTGDTVYVRAGTHRENVVVNKRLSLVGEDARNTIIDGGGAGNVVKITVGGVDVTGFTIRNGSSYPNAGIKLEAASHCNITGNNITNNEWGVLFSFSSDYNTVSGNNITANSRDGDRSRRMKAPAFANCWAL